MRYAWIIVLFIFAGCAARPGAETLAISRSTAVPGARIQTVYVVTTRLRAPAGDYFLDQGGTAPNFAEFTISIPPGHQPGMIEWPKDAPDPQASFAVLRYRALSRDEFQALTRPTPSAREAGIFVHGFNVNFQEGLFRTAQLSADDDIPGTPVLFSWPSAGRVGGYLRDKDAVTASRDALAATLIMLAQDRREVLVVGHSMGGWLTAETLRQLRLTGQTGTLAKLSVVLAAPDIDSEVFVSQLHAIGRMRRTMAVLVARDDNALKASSILAGDRIRAGAIDVRDPRVIDVAQRYNVEVVDISALQSQDGMHHSRYIQLFSRVGNGFRGSAPQRAGAFVLNSVGATLAAPFVLPAQALAGE